MPRLVVCAPGPSFDPKAVPNNGAEIAAINVALKPLERCRWWICFDAPNDVHQLAIATFLRLRPDIVTLDEDRIEGWQKWFRESCKLQPHEWPTVEVVDSGPLWFAVATKQGPRYSSSMAIAWALRRRFRELHFIGADMGGVGYFDPVASQLPLPGMKKPQLWHDRWKQERAIMAISQKVAHEHGYLRITGLPWEDPPPL